MDILAMLLTGALDKNIVGVLTANPITIGVAFVILKKIVSLTKTTVDDDLVDKVGSLFPFLNKNTKE